MIDTININVDPDGIVVLIVPARIFLFVSSKPQTIEGVRKGENRKARPFFFKMP